VRYLVVGGLALHAYGNDRVTYDVDLVIQRDQHNVLRAFEALARIGYKPMVPIQARQFADPVQRQRMIDEKGLVVLNFWSDQFQATHLDVFVAEPFDFEAEYEQGLREELIPGVELRYPTVDTLLRMKKLAGREKDQEDIRFLERSYGKRSE
jgi:hypothetical protein